MSSKFIFSNSIGLLKAGKFPSTKFDWLFLGGWKTDPISKSDLRGENLKSKVFWMLGSID